MSASALDRVLDGEPGHREALARARHGDPGAYLGPHEATVDGTRGVVVRTLQPQARRVELIAGDATRTMREVGPGLFAGWLPGPTVAAARYRLRLTPLDQDEADAKPVEDPYRFAAPWSAEDRRLLTRGEHPRLWDVLGARPTTLDGIDGFAFAVWAPNARRVSLVGDFCAWDGRRFPMRPAPELGAWELFLPHLGSGELYKYELVGADDAVFLKADPLARWAERPPGTASRTFRSSYVWDDGEWMERLATRDPRREPLSIYEVHLGSWARGQPDAADAVGTHPDTDPLADDDTPTMIERLARRAPAAPTYRELAPALVAHARRLGFDHLELMPVAEHPFDGSWGYQVTGYYAPTARWGSPDDFRFFVDTCHQQGLGVVLDWVPAHFVKDAHGLGRFDGTALYEHDDPRLGEHPDWGTWIFNYDRWEVRNFLVANALYWLDEFHIDGLRADAVASMLYLDYSREDGQWLPNRYGGRENLGAIELLRETNRQVSARHPGRMTIAEESTAWPRVTHPVDEGGLGFTFKWNMGWMHDTLEYFRLDPLFRGGDHDRLTFAMVYEDSESFLNPLSHDEVVHGKGSLLRKMPGDAWQRLANLRCLFGYQWTRPGKQLLFMGSELASPREWDPATGPDWFLLQDPERQGLSDYLAELGRLYRRSPCLWRGDEDVEGFQWIACHDRARSIFAYARVDTIGAEALDAEQPGTRSSRTEASRTDSSRTDFSDSWLLDMEISDADPSATEAPDARPLGDHLVVVLNLTPVPRSDVRLGAPPVAGYRVVLNSDDPRFGGSGYPHPLEITVEPVTADGFRQSMRLTLPPLAVLVLEPITTSAEDAA